jgi:hypothetical protein
MQVSRSGQIRTPCIHASSPMLTTAVSSCSSAGADAEANWPNPSSCCTPSRKRAPPTPPTRTVTFTPHDSTRDLSGDTEVSGVIAAWVWCRNALCDGCDRHAKVDSVSVSQKIGHEMIWKSSESLAKRLLPVSNHTSVISVGRPDSVSQTEIRSFVRIGMTDIKTVVIFTINETR